MKTQKENKTDVDHDNIKIYERYLRDVQAIREIYLMIAYIFSVVFFISSSHVIVNYFGIGLIIISFIVNLHSYFRNEKEASRIIDIFSNCVSDAEEEVNLIRIKSSKKNKNEMKFTIFSLFFGFLLLFFN